MVRHVPNGLFGGRATEVSAGAFLNGGHYGPEDVEPLRFITALALGEG